MGYLRSVSGVSAAASRSIEPIGRPLMRSTRWPVSHSGLAETTRQRRPPRAWAIPAKIARCLTAPTTSICTTPATGNAAVRCSCNSSRCANGVNHAAGRIVDHIEPHKGDRNKFFVGRLQSLCERRGAATATTPMRTVFPSSSAVL